ncbi:MAG: sulfatase-like hydrolase/transferase, partial [Verrucomicrobia bacterium]|nr:sulfatase-like hydrolase/transferase [Verrucomicrobiota bacterium]
LPTEKFQGRSQVGLYGDFVMMVDDVVGQVLNALEGSGLARNTLVLFSSDNGPVWYPEDTQRFNHDSAGGWRGMKSDAWEAGHRVPWIMRWIHRIPPGSTCPRTIGFVDLLATLADLVGYQLTQDESRDSVSFFACLTHPSCGTLPERPPLLIRSGGGFNTLRHGPWKLIQGLGSGGFTQPARIMPMPNQPDCQLYNLTLDPEEAVNLASAHPQIVEKLLQTLGVILKPDSETPSP